MVNNISFTGLISGLSSDEIIDAILATRRAPITQLENQVELKKFEKTAYQLVNLQATAIKKALLNLRLQSTFLTRKATSSSEAHLGVKAGYNAVPGVHSVTISSVAQGARAISGLDDRQLERAAAKMAYGNTAGITTIAMTANNLGGTRAVADTLLTETLQAGTGDAKITQGDKIKIEVTLKDSSTNTVYFTFQNDGTDTLERLRQTIRSAFKGEAQVAIDSNGAFLITETDPAASGSISLDGLTFSDEDYSGSTFTLSIGGTTAGNVATARTIVGTRTFTTGSSANIADGTELLTALDQWGGGSFSGDETIEISGKQFDGTAVSSSFSVSGTTTLNDLITELQTLFNDATNPPWETTVTLENGKIVLRDQTAGASETEISMYFYDADGNLDLQTGTFVTTDAGSDDITQTIRTSAFTESAVGRHIVTSSDGKGGSVTGTVSLNAGTILSSLGVTETGLFTIDRDDGSGAIDPVTVFGVTSRSTVQDLITAINAQVPGVTAQLVDDGAGAYYLQIVAAEGGVDFRLTDDAAGNGILEKVLNPDTGSTDTDISTLNDSALASVESATTTGDDYTFTTAFTPDNGGPVQRRTVIGSTGTAVTDLIANVSLQGAGNNFTGGDALIYTNISSELNVGPATSTFVIGDRGVSDDSNTSTPSLNIYTTIDNSGSATAITSGTFTINGVGITIDNTDTVTIDELLGSINSSGAGVIAEYDPVHDRFILRRPDAGNTDEITLGGAGDTSNFLTAVGLTTGFGAVQFDGSEEDTVNTESALAYSGLTIPMVSGTFTINGVKISVNTAIDSLQDVIDRINNSPVGVTASYDSVQDRLILTQDLTKKPLYNRITIGSATDTSNLWASMRLTDYYQTSQYVGTSRTRAAFTVDGQSYIRDSNTVNDIINDVTLTINGVTSDPVSVVIETDTDKALTAIRDFVVEYNKLIDLINVESLSDDERENMAALTDDETESMTSTQIDDYNSEREQLYISDYIFNSMVISRLDSNLRLNLLSPVKSMASGEIRVLSDLGINTGAVGAGIASAGTPYLITDSTDPDTILEKLQNNSTLADMLESDPEEVYKLFSNEITSNVEIIGNVNISSGITLSAPLNFSIGNGLLQATVTLSTGYHTASNVMSTITNQLAQAGFGSDIRVYLTSGGFLQITGETDYGRARISLQDLGGGSSLASSFGIAPQTVVGENAVNNAGLSRRLDSLLDAYVGSDGVVTNKIKTGGTIDQDLDWIDKRIDDYEYRLSIYEERLRLQFARMEVALSEYQSTSQFIQSYLNSGTSASSTSASTYLSS